MKKPWLCNTVLFAFLLCLTLWAFSGGCRDKKKKFFIPPAFSLVFTDPADGATGVGLWPVIVMSFNYAVDPATAVPANIVIEQSGGGSVNGMFYIADDAATVLFVPDAALSPSTGYTVTLTNSVLSSIGLPLDLTNTTNPVTFTTTGGSDTNAPTFAGATGAMLLTDGIEVTWNAATDDVAAQSEIVYFIYRAQASGAQNYSAPYAVTPPGRTTFLDLGEIAVQYYVVRARDTFGNIDANTAEVWGGGVPPLVSYSADLEPILDFSCALVGCHAGTFPTANLDLSSYTPLDNSHNGIMDMVIIGSPDNSELIWRLEGTIPLQMPLVGGPLSASEIQRFRNWITQGAQEN